MALPQKIAALFSAALVLTGCGYASGFLRDSTTANQHQFQQAVTHVSYLRSVASSTSFSSILCLIPLNSEPYREVMDDLHAAAALKPNQMLENIREDHMVLTFIVFCGHKITISADIVEVTPVGSPPPKMADHPLVPAAAAPTPVPAPSGLPKCGQDFATHGCQGSSRWVPEASACEPC